MRKSVVSILLAIRFACALGDPLIGSLPSLPTYTTNFSATENPLSEGGRWTNGGTVGLDWQNAQSTTGSPNKGYGTGFSTNATDNIAILSGYPANQSAQITVYYAPGYTAPGSHEIELLLRFQITAHNASGYETTFRFDGTGVQIVRWNGAVDDYTVLSSTGTGISSLATGDVLKATMIGTTINVYKNGTLVQTVTDATFATGNPGIGFFVNPGGTLDGYCISQFTAAGL